MADTPAEENEFQAPKVDGNGFAVHGDGLPRNLRLRAEALVAAGKHEDEGGLVSNELIADTAKRLDRAQAAKDAADKARPAATMSQSRDELVDIAENIRVANNLDAPLHDPDATKQAIVDAITAARAAGMEG